MVFRTKTSFAQGVADGALRFFENIGKQEKQPRRVSGSDIYDALNGSSVTQQSNGRSKRYSKFINSLSDVELYRYIDKLKNIFYRQDEIEDGNYFIRTRRLKRSGFKNDIEDYFSQFLLSNVSDVGIGNLKFRDFLSILGGFKKLNNETVIDIDNVNGRKILGLFFEFLFLSNEDIDFDESRDFDELLSNIQNEFSLQTQSVAHRHISMRLKRLNPLLSVINSDSDLSRIFKNSRERKPAEGYKDKSRTGLIDEKTNKQFTKFFATISKDLKLMRLFYEGAMIIARKESEERRTKLFESGANGPVRIEGLRIGLGINGGIVSEVERNLYPYKSEGTLTVGKEDYFGGSFNLGGFLEKGFMVNSRNRGDDPDEIAFPTFEGAINNGGSFSQVDESVMHGNDYSYDYHWGFEAFTKHFFHSNHLFDCEVVSQEQTNEGYIVRLRNTKNSKVVKVLTNDVNRTAGIGVHNVGCREMSKASFDIVQKSEQFDALKIRDELIAYMRTDEYKKAKSAGEKFNLNAISSLPRRLNSQQFLSLAKIPGFPLDVLLEGLQIGWIGDGDTTFVGLERVYTDKNTSAEKQGYKEPISFVIGKTKVDYKQELKSKLRARYGRIVNAFASADASTENFKIIPIQGEVISYFDNGEDRSGTINFKTESKFKVNDQISDYLTYDKKTKNGTIDYDLLIDCTGYNSSGIEKVFKTEKDNQNCCINDTLKNPEKCKAIRGSLYKNIQQSTDIMNRFFLSDNSWFEVRFADTLRVVIGAYNAETNEFQESTIYRGDFEQIFSVSSEKDTEDDDENLYITKSNSSEFFSFTKFLGLSRGDSNDLLLLVERDEAFKNIFTMDSTIESIDYNELSDSKEVTEIIKSVFGIANKEEIELFVSIADKFRTSDSGTKYFGPMGKILTPDFSVFEKQLLTEKLNIGENTAARFRYRRRIYCAFYRDYGSRNTADRRRKLNNKIEGKEIISGNVKAKQYEQNKRTDFAFELSDNGLENVKYIYDRVNYTDYGLLFWAELSECISEYDITSIAGDKKSFEKGIDCKLRIERGNDGFGSNQYTISVAEGGNSLQKSVNQFLVNLIYANRSLWNYLAYTVSEKGFSRKAKSGNDDPEITENLELFIPLVIKNGKLALDTGGIDRKEYNDKLNERIWSDLGERAKKLGDKVVNVIGGVKRGKQSDGVVINNEQQPRGRKAKNVSIKRNDLYKTKSPKFNKIPARFGFYNPGTNQKVA